MKKKRKAQKVKQAKIKPPKVANKASFQDRNKTCQIDLENPDAGLPDEQTFDQNFTKIALKNIASRSIDFSNV